MTNSYNLISAVQCLAANENANRFGGKPRLKVDAPKVEVYLFQSRTRIDWHSDVPNHLCAFIDSFDNDHCAAYVYLWEEEDRLRCTLRLSNIDGAHREDLPYLSKSLNDHQIAERVIASVITGTEPMKATDSTPDQY
jgi:hypothetical protein